MLVGTGALGYSGQGFSVSVSSDGNTAVVGGPFDNENSATGNGVGATWAFARWHGVWNQQGPKLVGTGATGNAQQGYSVSLSGDGSTAFAGGPYDNNGAGAAWVFAEPIFAGTPGQANCFGQSGSALAQQYSGLNNAADALGFTNSGALQNAILAFCGG